MIRISIKEYNKSIFFVLNIYIKIMLNRNIQGVDISEYETVKIDKKMIQDVDLDKFPPNRVHFLVYALQNQCKLPS